MAKKYIDADKLIAEIKRLQCEQGFEDGETERGYQVAIKDILRVITSLQQEQNSIQDTELTGFESALFTAFSYAWQSYLKGEEVNVIQWVKENSAELLEAARFQQEQPDEQPDYGYLSTKYVHGKKSKWNAGDVLAYYICTSNEEGEYTLGKIVNVEFDGDDWIYTFENGDVSDEQSLIENGTYKKN